MIRVASVFGGNLNKLREFVWEKKLGTLLSFYDPHLISVDLMCRIFAVLRNQRV